MITDKDREDWIKRCDNSRIFIDELFTNLCEPALTGNKRSTFISMLATYEGKIRTESAEQARKEAAENGIIFMQERLVPGVFTDIMLDEMRAAMLNDTVKEGKTDAEKLAIAVKALEYVASKSLPSNAFESHYSRLQDACAKASDALKEIQG